LLGASAMREPYLLTFNTLVLWGFVHRFYRFEDSPAISRLSNLSNLLKDRIGWMWIALGLTGMLLVSPAVALTTILVFAGWLFFASERREISWRALAAVGAIFILGLFFLSASLNRSGEFAATSPLHVINDWFQAAIKWDAYQLERESGWVQKIFDEGPRWIQLPFVAVYGIFQPVLPASLVHPTIWIWKVIVLARSLTWYVLLPLLILSFIAAASQEAGKRRNLLLWLCLLVWTWILLAALRGGADLWDNPRYRTILFVWQALLGGIVWVWWRETRNPWLPRIFLMEVIFILIFTQWYASRYFHLGGQLPFAVMIALILGGWVIVLGLGLWWDRRGNPAVKPGSPVDKSRA
ncbi:MAG: hypothetical protein M3Y68_14760, partial [Chloroflexota bacterium]|nr:hypothetical protein [Chloroflexota bacterium]